MLSFFVCCNRYFVFVLFLVSFALASSPYSCASSPAVTLSAAQLKDHHSYNNHVTTGNTLCVFSHGRQGAQPCHRGYHHYWDNIGQFAVVQILRFVEAILEVVTRGKKPPESHCQVIYGINYWSLPLYLLIA